MNFIGFVFGMMRNKETYGFCYHSCRFYYFKVMTPWQASL